MQNVIDFNLIVQSLCPTDNHLYLMRSYGKGYITKFLSKEAKEWKEMVQIFANLTWKKEPTNEKLSAVIVFYLKRDRDVMGAGKLIFDSLQGIVYKNDSQFIDVRFVKKIDKEYPRVEIHISKNDNT